MNIPLNFCAKCGNPRNPGEKICRFCGEPFPENKPNLDIFGPEQDANDSDSTVMSDDKNNNEPELDAAETTTPADSGKNEASASPDGDPTVYSHADNETEPAQQDCLTDDSEEQTSVDSSTSSGVAVPSGAPSSSKSSYIKVPKKGLWITLGVLLAIAIGVGITLFVLSRRNSPSATVEKAFEALKKNDSEGFCDQFNLSNTTQPYARDVVRKMMSFLSGNFKDIEILDEKVEDQKAVVTVNIIFDDNKTEEMELHLVKIDDQWKIEPLGDMDFGLDSLFELGKKFGFGSGGSLKDDIDDIFNNLF